MRWRRAPGGDDACALGEAVRRTAPAPPPGMDDRVLAAVGADARRAAALPRRVQLLQVRGRTPYLQRALAVAALTAATVLLATASLDPALHTEEAQAVPIVPLTADCGAHDGRLVVAGVWAGEEGRRFATVLRRFEQRTGIAVTYAYETRNIAATLEGRIDRGCAPDVALLPQPGLLGDLARRGHLEPLDAATRKVVRRHYAPAWRQLGSAEGRLYGVWFKAADKSTFWYRRSALRRAGVDAPPRSWPELLETARSLAAGGTRPLAVAGAAPWTLTDWFENLYLHGAGPVPYAKLAAHRIPWTDPTVVRVLRQLGTLLGDPALVGGAGAALETSFEESVAQVFGARRGAAMVYEGDFVRSFLPSGARRDAGMFDFPGTAPGAARAAVVGGDVAVQFRGTADARRLLRYLATPQAAAPWARAGGFLSPNRGLDPRAYRDPLARRAAEGLARTAIVRFDLSDLQPPAFGATAEQGMWEIFQDFLADPRDPEATARRLEAAARAAWECQRRIAGRC